MNLYVPDYEDADYRAALEWWRALDPGTRMVFLHAAWQLEGSETPDQLEPHQRNPRYRPSESEAQP